MANNRIKGITIEIGGDTTDLQKSLKVVDSALKSTQSNLKDINRLLKLDPSNVDLLKQKQDNLKNAITDTKDRLKVLKDAYKELDGKEGLEAKAQQEALKREIIETEQNLKSLKEQYSESQQNAFYREVQEDVQAEQLSKSGNKYKKYIISIITVILLITIAKNWFIAYKKEASLKSAKQFEQLMSKEKVSVDERIADLQEFAKTAKFGYKDIAYFNIYSTQIENKRYNDAIDTLEEIIKDSSDEVFENIAIIKLGTMLSSLSGKDLTSVKKKLSDIGSSKPLSATAKFVLGTIYLKENNFDSAKKIFEELSDDINLPISLKSQSLTLLNHIKSVNIK